jgi:hypothetical protein
LNSILGQTVEKKLSQFGFCPTLQGWKPRVVERYVPIQFTKLKLAFTAPFVLSPFADALHRN